MICVEVVDKVVPDNITRRSFASEGIGNKTYLPLLTLIPVFNIVWIFVVGFKGNEWSWQKGDYQDVDTFKAVQATWNRAGLVQFIIAIVIWALYMLVFASLVTSLINGHY